MKCKICEAYRKEIKELKAIIKNLNDDCGAGLTDRQCRLVDNL